MDYFNIYGNKSGEPEKLIFFAVIEAGLKTAFKTANENKIEISKVIKIGDHSNFFTEEDVTEEIKSKI